MVRNPRKSNSINDVRKGKIPMYAGETSGYYQAQIAKVAHMLTTQVVREAYEVVQV
jgi:hypothetical protein